MHVSNKFIDFDSSLVMDFCRVAMNNNRYITDAERAIAQDLVNAIALVNRRSTPSESMLHQLTLSASETSAGGQLRHRHSFNQTNEGDLRARQKVTGPIESTQQTPLPQSTLAPKIRIVKLHAFMNVEVAKAVRQEFKRLYDAFEMKFNEGPAANFLIHHRENHPQGYKKVKIHSELVVEADKRPGTVAT